MININHYLKKHQRLTSCLSFLLTFATYWFYIIFILQLILVATRQSIKQSFVLLIYNVISFTFLTWFRDLLNKPRPYEVMQITPVIKKNTKGHSFPSRHVFSSLLITLNWLVILSFMNNPFIICLTVICFIFTLYIVIVRVLFTIHYPIDVTIAMLLAWLCYSLFSGIIHVIH